MDLNQTKQKLYEQLASSPDVDDITKNLSALKLVEEIEKTVSDKAKVQLDIDNLDYQKKNDWKKFYFGMLAPFITSIGLIITLLITISQNKTNFEFQKDTQDYDRWKTLLDKINSPLVANDPSIPILLKSFYKNDKYKDNAMVISESYFLKIQDADLFRSLMEDYAPLMNKDNYKNLVALTRALENQYVKMKQQVDDDSRHLVYKGPPVPLIIDYNKQIAVDSTTKNALIDNLLLAGSCLRDVIVRINIDGLKLDLSNAYFLHTNLDSVNFQKTILRGVQFDQVSVKNTDFSNVNDFADSYWNDTEWWQAKNVSPKLVSYLVKYHPYQPNQLNVHYVYTQKNDQQLYNGWLKQLQKE